MLLLSKEKGMHNTINISHLNKTYENGTVALSDFSYSFEYGRMYAVTGHSGAGKTTLIQMIASFIPPTDGVIEVNGKNIVELTSDERTMYRRNSVGFVFQSYLLNPRLNALENVMLPMLAGSSDYDECVAKSTRLLDEMGLGELKESFPNKMSGGEQQRVSIARALVNDPKIILADEPTGNLDSENQNMILGILRGLADRGKCVIVVSHSADLAGAADESIKLEKGKVV